MSPQPARGWGSGGWGSADRTERRCQGDRLTAPEVPILAPGSAMGQATAPNGRTERPRPRGARGGRWLVGRQLEGENGGQWGSAVGCCNSPRTPHSSPAGALGTCPCHMRPRDVSPAGPRSSLLFLEDVSAVGGSLGRGRGPGRGEPVPTPEQTSGGSAEPLRPCPVAAAPCRHGALPPDPSQMVSPRPHPCGPRSPHGSHSQSAPR